MSAGDFDVVVVGGSIGGCATARLYAQQGLRVAVVERRPEIDAYKTVCTHFIQPSAVPVIERLGLTGELEARGAVRTSVDVWTPYGGWIRHRQDTPYGCNVTRRTLDPLLRRMTAETPGVELLTGWTATDVLGNGRPTGIAAEDPGHTRRELRARLVVAADGRGSRIARLTRTPGRVRPHNRFFYWAYWRGVPNEANRSRMWFTEPDCAYTFPNEEGLSVVVIAPHRDRLPEFRADLEGAYERFLTALPDPPDLTGATRESKLLGKLDMPNVSRPAARPGLAFVGDAALASDPLWGVGCGWALQSAAWLVDSTAAPLAEDGDVDSGLEDYRRLHRRRLGPHHFMIADLSSGRQANPVERALYRGAAADDDVFHVFEAIGSRRRSPATLFAPRTLWRLARPVAR